MVEKAWLKSMVEKHGWKAWLESMVEKAWLEKRGSKSVVKKHGYKSMVKKHGYKPDLLDIDAGGYDNEYIENYFKEFSDKMNFFLDNDHPMWDTIT